VGLRGERRGFVSGVKELVKGASKAVVRYARSVAGETTWLALPDVALRLKVPVSRVRELVRERHLLAVRRGENDALHVPESFLIEGPDGLQPIPTLRGTVILLADAGLTDDHVMRWLLDDNDELGQTPVDALRSGKRAHVRRVAQTYA